MYSKGQIQPPTSALGQARGRAGTSAQQVSPSAQGTQAATVNVALQRSLGIDHHLSQLVYHILQTNPVLLVKWLHENQQWLSIYVAEFHGARLPPLKGHISGLSSVRSPRHGSMSGRSTGAKSQHSAPAQRLTPASMTQQPQQSTPGPLNNPVYAHPSSTSVINTEHYPTPVSSSSKSSSTNFQQQSVDHRTSRTASQDTQPASNYQQQFVDPRIRRKATQATHPADHYQHPPIQRYPTAESSSTAGRSSNYQNASIENATSYDSSDDCRSESPQSTSSLPSGWPSDQDLNVPYPAPDDKLLEEASLPRGTGFKWTFEEQDMAIGYMWEMHNDPRMPRTEKRFEEVSRRMMKEKGIERSKISVKNMWNRIGRNRSKLDERKNKSAPLATSLQGKQARHENEVKKSLKRKAFEEPLATEPTQKKAKVSTSIAQTFAEEDLSGYMPYSDGSLAIDFTHSFPSNTSSTMVNHVNPHDIWPQRTTHGCDSQDVNLASKEAPPLPNLADSEFNELFGDQANFNLGGNGSLDEWDQDFASVIMSELPGLGQGFS